MKKIGLVTVLFNCPEVLPDFFSSLAAQSDKNWQLEVIDNSTNEASLDMAVECAARFELKNVSFTKNENNFGVAKANNQGIQKCLDSGCEYIILLNNDIVFSHQLFASVRSALDGGNFLVAPRIHYFDNNTLWYAGGRIRPIAATAEHYRDRLAVSNIDLEDRNTDYAPTCFIGIRAEVFERVGLMDERYFVYYDDTDFIYRCRKAGYPLLYLGSAELKHKVSSATGGGGSDFSIFYYNRNRLFFIIKNYYGFEKALGIFWYFVTRIYKFFCYKQKQRAILINAMKSAFGLR